METADWKRVRCITWYIHIQPQIAMQSRVERTWSVRSWARRLGLPSWWTPPAGLPGGVGARFKGCSERCGLGSRRPCGSRRARRGWCRWTQTATTPAHRCRGAGAAVYAKYAPALPGRRGIRAPAGPGHGPAWAGGPAHGGAGERTFRTLSALPSLAGFLQFVMPSLWFGSPLAVLLQHPYAGVGVSAAPGAPPLPDSPARPPPFEGPTLL